MSDRKILLTIVFIVTVFFGLTFKGVSGNLSQENIVSNYSSRGQIFESSEVKARFFLTENLVQKGSFILDESTAKVSLPDVSYKDGQYFSTFLPGVSVIVSLGYLLGNYLDLPLIGTFAVPAGFTILTAFFIFHISRKLKLSKTASFLASLIYPLATIAWGYSVTLSSQPFSAFFLMSSLYFAIKSKEGRGYNHFVVWLLYGLSIVVDYSNVLILLPVVILMFSQGFDYKREKKIYQRKSYLQIRLASLYTIFPLVVAVVALLYYNKLTLGSFYGLASNYQVSDLIDGTFSNSFKINRLFDLNFIENGLRVLLLSFERGLVFYSPILLFSLMGIKSFLKKGSNIAKVMLLVTTLNLLLFSAYFDPWGGWSYGPRYLIVSMPLLSVMVGHVYDLFKKYSLFLIFFYVVLLLSFSIALLGVTTTNLLPPTAELGKSVGFWQNFAFLENGRSEMLAFNFLKKFQPMFLLDYVVILFSLSLMIFLPIFFNQLFDNLKFFFGPIIQKIKAFSIKKVKEEI